LAILIIFIYHFKSVYLVAKMIKNQLYNFEYPFM